MSTRGGFTRWGGLCARSSRPRPLCIARHIAARQFDALSEKSPLCVAFELSAQLHELRGRRTARSRSTPAFGARWPLDPRAPPRRHTPRRGPGFACEHRCAPGAGHGKHMTTTDAIAEPTNPMYAPVRRRARPGPRDALQKARERGTHPVSPGSPLPQTRRAFSVQTQATGTASRLRPLETRKAALPARAASRPCRPCVTWRAPARAQRGSFRFSCWP